MKKLSILATILALFSAGISANAWNGLGHRTIVEIAKRHLTDKAKANIAKFIPYDIVQDASYMDIHRNDPELAYAYHFHEQCVDLKTLKYDPNAHVETGDVSRALWLAEYNLGHWEEVPDSTVALNIRFVLHFVGDLHCPVHVGIPSSWQPRPPFRQDKGKWYWNGKNYSSFHQFIDRTSLIYFPKMEAAQIAQLLDVNVSKKQAKAWCKGTVEDWTYDGTKTGFRIYDTFPPVWDIPNTPEEKYIPNDYAELIKPIITLQMVKAGYRMAYLLNKYFDK